MDDQEKMLMQLSSQQAAADEQIRTLFNRVDELGKLTDSVHRLACSIQSFANRLEATETRLGRLSDDLDTIKRKPAKLWDSVITVTLTATVTAFITYIFTTIGLK